MAEAKEKQATKVAKAEVRSAEKVVKKPTAKKVIKKAELVVETAQVEKSQESCGERGEGTAQGRS
jgi:hypothetical protein